MSDRVVAPPLTREDEARARAWLEQEIEFASAVTLIAQLFATLDQARLERDQQERFKHRANRRADAAEGLP